MRSQPDPPEYMTTSDHRGELAGTNEAWARSSNLQMFVDRVVQLSNGEYEVHYIGVNWPHHIFVNQDFKVVGAD